MVSTTERVKKIIAESAKQKKNEANKIAQAEKNHKRRLQSFKEKQRNAGFEVFSEDEHDQAYVDGLRKSKSTDVVVDENSNVIKLKFKKQQAKGHVKMERLHKVIARAGITSVRKAEELILEGRVSVDGSVASIGQQVNILDRSIKIRVDGVVIPHFLASKQPCRVLIYHKAEGEISTKFDPEDRSTIFDRLPRLQLGRWVQVGRLDANTSGLMLFTNDGELAHRLMHPSYQIERKYICRVYGEVTPEMLERLQTGVELEDGVAKFNKIRPFVNASDEERVNNQSSNSWYEVTLNEGRNHEVRRLWESQGVIVSRLARNEYAGICLNREMRIPKSGYLEADLNEINMLRGLVGLPPEKEGFRPGSYGQSKSELKRQKQKLYKDIRGAIKKDKSHKLDRGRVYDEKNADKRGKREQLASDISSRNKQKFGGKKDYSKKSSSAGQSSSKSKFKVDKYR